MRDAGIKIVYDMDGVLNQINEYIFDKLGIANKMNLKYYNIFDNTHILSRDEMEKIIEMYNNPNAFRLAKPVPGVHRIMDIYYKLGYNVDIYVHSLCYNQSVKKAKEKWLRQYAGIPWNRMILEVGTHKSVLDSVDIIIEDCLENIIASKAGMAKILVDKTHNKFETYGYSNNNIIRAIKLNSAIDIVEEVVSCYERNTGYLKDGYSVTGRQ